MVITINSIFKMKHLLKSSLFLALSLIGTHSFANEIKAFSVSQAQTTPGAQVSFIIEANKAGPSSTLWCGINIDFGNGSSADVRLGLNGDADLRYTQQYSYPSPGTYTATLSGKGLTRGLKSAIACNGPAQKVSIKVLDPDVIRMQMELERTKRDQVVRDQMARDSADRITRENMERNRQLETQKKEQELHAKTQELERKVRELEQANNKASPPVARPAPSATTPKSEPKENSAPPAKKGKADSIL
jgi:hypothetical protein